MPTFEYAVEVPNLGYVVTTRPQVIVSNTIVAVDACSEDRESAENTAKTVAAQYRQLGLPVIASTVHVIRRTVTVTRGDWEPVE